MEALKIWQALALLLVLTCGFASCVAAPPFEASTVTADGRSVTPAPESPHAPRTADVIVIDVTSNTSSIVHIPINNENLTASETLQLSSLRCIVQHKANVFLLVHLNRHWRQKLNFIRKLIPLVYEQGTTNVAIVFFNAFTNVLATFGTDPLTRESDLLHGLARVQLSMERDESAALSEHWVYFQLDDALRTAFRYAKVFLHQLSLDARPSILLTYFDEGAVITDDAVDEAEKVLHLFKPQSPFKASISIMQWPSSKLPVSPIWTRVADLLSSSPGYQVTGVNENNLLGLLAHLVPDVCNRTMSAL